MKYFLVIWLLSGTPAGVGTVIPVPYQNLVACTNAGEAWTAQGMAARFVTPRYFACVPHE